MWTNFSKTFFEDICSPKSLTNPLVSAKFENYVEILYRAALRLLRIFHGIFLRIVSIRHNVSPSTNIHQRQKCSDRDTSVSALYILNDIEVTFIQHVTNIASFPFSLAIDVVHGFRIVSGSNSENA